MLPSLTVRSPGDRNEYPQLWILKPQQSYNQMGISMVYLEAADVASDDATYKWMERIIPLDGSWTLQVCRPNHEHEHAPHHTHLA